MKKIVLSLIAAFGLAFVANAQTTEEYTNAFGQEFTVVTAQAESTTVPTEIPFPGSVVIGTAAPTGAPDQIGQIAIDRGQAAYVAVGTTASDWKGLVTFTATAVTDPIAMTGIIPDCAGSIYYGAKLVVGAATGSVAIATTAAATGWKLIDLYD